MKAISHRFYVFQGAWGADDAFVRVLNAPGVSPATRGWSTPLGNPQGHRRADP